MTSCFVESTLSFGLNVLRLHQFPIFNDKHWAFEGAIRAVELCKSNPPQIGNSRIKVGFSKSQSLALAHRPKEAEPDGGWVSIPKPEYQRKLRQQQQQKQQQAAGAVERSGPSGGSDKMGVHKYRGTPMYNSTGTALSSGNGSMRNPPSRGDVMTILPGEKSAKEFSVGISSQNFD